MSLENTATAETQETAEQLSPVFEEITNIDETTAVNVLIQAAQLAQNSGRLSVRDSVLIGKVNRHTTPRYYLIIELKQKTKALIFIRAFFIYK